MSNLIEITDTHVYGVNKELPPSEYEGQLFQGALYPIDRVAEDWIVALREDDGNLYRVMEIKEDSLLCEKVDAKITVPRDYYDKRIKKLCSR